jgi:exodeoxyribonuclease VII large subunit
MADFISLSELNLRVKKVLEEKFTQTYKIVAEISEINENRGHAYLELAEKNSETGKIAAKARAVIWASFYRMIKPYFRSMTGNDLESGMKILISVQVEFHEIYGYSLNINDIDPTYTLGDIERKRLEIIRKLEEDGVIDMNKELDFPLVPQRIAVISSENAAGYGDFLRQIQNNEPGFFFHIKLFPAQMQGENAQFSIIEALDRIYIEQQNFDIAVIVRGGGSKFDLSCFDDYDLALNIAQFPLPVLAGIGHERDTSVADLTAHTSVKTPTAAADFLISRMNNFEVFLKQSASQLSQKVKEFTFQKRSELQLLSSNLKPTAAAFLENQKYQLKDKKTELKNSTIKRISRENYLLERLPSKIRFSVKYKIQKIGFILEQKSKELQYSTQKLLSDSRYKLKLSEQKIQLQDPENIIKLGYSLTVLNRKIIRKKEDVKKGDIIETRVSNGSFNSEIL